MEGGLPGRHLLKDTGSPQFSGHCVMHFNATVYRVDIRKIFSVLQCTVVDTVQRYSSLRDIVYASSGGEVR